MWKAVTLPTMYFCFIVFVAFITQIELTWLDSEMLPSQTVEEAAGTSENKYTIIMIETHRIG